MGHGSKWECGGLSSNIVVSPVAAGGVVWTRRRGTPYVPSPLLYGDTLYNLQHYQGVVVRIVAKTGADQGEPVRLTAIRDVYASPVGAAGRVYITSREGVTQVLSHGDEPPKMLAVNRLNDSFSASAALVGRALFLRGERYLYCIAEDTSNLGRAGEPRERREKRCGNCLWYIEDNK